VRNSVESMRTRPTLPNIFANMDLPRPIETPFAPMLRYGYRRGEIKSCFR
jgi:hypothetical protein